jgi:hypothetical protein
MSKKNATSADAEFDAKVDAEFDAKVDAKARRDEARATNAASGKVKKETKTSKSKPKASKFGKLTEAAASKAVEAVDQVAAKAAAVTVANKSLAPIAKEVNVRFDKIAKLEGDANDHRLSASLQIARAAQICEGAGIKFKDWAADNLKDDKGTPRPWETVRKLLYVGKADEPAKALADQRAAGKKAQAKLRDKKKTTEATARVTHAPIAPIDVVVGLKPEDQLALVKKVSKDLGMSVVSETDAKALDQFRKEPMKVVEKPAAKTPFGYDAIVAGIGDLKTSDKVKLLRWLADVVGYNVVERKADEGLEIPGFLLKGAAAKAA